MCNSTYRCHVNVPLVWSFSICSGTLCMVVLMWVPSLQFCVCVCCGYPVRCCLWSWHWWHSSSFMDFLTWGLATDVIEWEAQLLSRKISGVTAHDPSRSHLNPPHHPVVVHYHHHIRLHKIVSQVCSALDLMICRITVVQHWRCAVTVWSCCWRWLHCRIHGEIRE